MEKSKLRLRDLWDIPSGLTYTLKESQKEQRKKVAKRLFGEINGWTILEFFKIDESTNWKSSTNSK